MFTLFSIFILIAAVLLILVVLVQNSKGGGLASNFAGSNQVMGVRQTTDFLEKATWYLAGAVIIFSIAASMSIDRSTGQVNDSLLKDQVENANTQNVIPTTVPQTTETPVATQPATTQKEEAKEAE